MVYNVGYLTGVTGNFWEYLFMGSFFLFSHTKVRGTSAQKLGQVVKEIDPDILFLTEVKNQEYLQFITSQFSQFSIESKYQKGSIFHYLPFFRGNCNAVFFKKPHQVEVLYLQNGVKKLLYRAHLNAFTDLYLAHFALGKKTRRKQFQEVAKLTKQKKQAIVGGDFNIFGGTVEVTEMAESAGINIVTDEDAKTFPSFRPVHNIDLFLASPTITVSQVRVLKEVLFSDHLPIVADFEIDTD